MNTFPRGSEWRLWDLHIHTPFSFNYANSEFKAEPASSVELIADNINKSKVAAYAINDYWTFDGYLALRDFSLKRSRIEKLILPGIELRLEAASKHRLNVHVILSDNVTSQQLADFKSTLKLRVVNSPLSREAFIRFARELDDSKAKIHGFKSTFRDNDEESYQLGCMTAEVTRQSFREALEAIPGHQRLVMLPYDCYGGADEVDWKTQFSENLELLRMGDLIETRRRETAGLFGLILKDGNESLIRNFSKTIGGNPKPCVSGSDGHSIGDFLHWKENVAHAKTWIKADPTFEGLRQILFEPNERVRIQSDNPSRDFLKPHFSGIHIKQVVPPFKQSGKFDNPSFSQNECLHLNSNLVCLIGGRGAGKSCLVEYIGSFFSERAPDEKFVPSEEFIVEYMKDQSDAVSFSAVGGKVLPFVFISQGEVKRRIEDGSIYGEIMRMLGIDEVHRVSSQAEAVKRLFSSYQQAVADLDARDENGRRIYDDATISSRLAQSQSLLDMITTESNREKLNKYVHNLGQIGSLENRIGLAERTLDELKRIVEEFTLLCERNELKVTPISINIQVAEISSIISDTESVRARVKSEIDAIREAFSAVYTGDLSTLLENARQLQNLIANFESLKAECDKRVKALEHAKSELSKATELLLQEHESERDRIDRAWTKTRLGHDDWTADQKGLISDILVGGGIEIRGEDSFDVVAFYEQLKTFFDLRSLRATGSSSTDDRLREVVAIRDYYDYLSCLKMGPDHILSWPGVREEALTLFYDPAYRSRYLFVRPVIRYQSRPIEVLSVGQKGTIYLCLKLATQLFSSPIIYDQPEDDLDNEFITNELVSIFRKVKKYRQVILVTHNANVVVNADAEQVVVATNEGGLISFDSGSLEDPEVNILVRRVLEGGDRAFRQREQKYQLLE